MGKEENHERLVEQYYHFVDSLMDAEKFGQLFSVTGEFQIGNHPVSIGRESIAASAQFVFNSVKALKHTVHNLVSINASMFLMEGSVTYTMPSGSLLDAIPFATIVDLNETDSALIQSARCYVDLSPLIAAITK